MNKTLLRLGRSIKRPIHVFHYLRYRDSHESPSIFIAGLPKSGTTWLAKMFASVPGYRMTAPWYITQVNHDLNERTFREFDHQLVVIRLHLAWTEQNGRILEQEQQKYVVMYRDLRDTVVSWYYYVTKVDRRHFLHDEIRNLSLHEGIDYYIEHYLTREVDWIRNWRKYRHPLLSTEVRYEDLRRDTFAEMRRLADFFGLNLCDERVSTIVEKNAFKQVARRRPGEEDVTSHQRKGVVGDWRNAFLPRHVEAFKRMAGDLLIESGYEKDLKW